MSPARRLFLGLAALGVAVTLAGVLVPVAEVRWVDLWPAVIEIDSDIAGAEGVRDNWPVTSAEVRWRRGDSVIRVAHRSYSSGLTAKGDSFARIAFLMLPALALMAAFPRRRLVPLPLAALSVSVFAVFLAPRSVGAMVFSGEPVVAWWPTAALVPVGAFLAFAGSLLWLLEPREMEDEWVERSIALRKR